MFNEWWRVSFEQETSGDTQPDLIDALQLHIEYLTVRNICRMVRNDCSVAYRFLVNHFPFGLYIIHGGHKKTGQ